MIRLGWYVVVVLATLTVLVLLWQFNIAVALFLLSLATAAAFRPPINYLEKRGHSRIFSLLLVYFLVILVFSILLAGVTRPLLTDIGNLSDQAATSYDQIKNTWPESGDIFQQTIAKELPPSDKLYAALTGERGAAIMQSIFGAASNTFEFLSRSFIVLILSMYWNADNIRFERLWLTLIPVERRTRARTIWRDIETGVGAYIRSEILQSILAGLLLGFAYQVMGVQYPVLLAVVGALAWFIPWLGGIIAIILPFLVGLDTSLGLALLASSYTLAIWIVMETIIEPRIFPRKGYSSVLLVIITLVMALTFGLIGVILAPPLSAAIQILAHNLYEYFHPSLQTQIVDKMAALQLKLADIQDHLAKEDEEPSPNIIDLTRRLNMLVEKVDAYLEEN